MAKLIRGRGEGLSYVVPNSYPYRKKDIDKNKDRVQKEFKKLCEKYDRNDLSWQLYANHIKRRTGAHILRMNIEDQGIIIQVLKRVFNDESKYQNLVNLVKGE